MTAGSRYCLLPFIYDDAAAEIRERNRSANVSDAEGVALYREAAESGDTEAQYRLGVMYESGRGIERDLARAHLWFGLSAESASGERQDQAIEGHRRVAAQMSAEELAISEELLRQRQTGNSGG